VATNLKNPSFSGHSLENLGNYLGILCKFRKQNYNQQNNVTKCGFWGAKCCKNMFATGALPQTNWEPYISPQITIITITFCCDSLWICMENKPTVLEKPGKSVNFLS